MPAITITDLTNAKLDVDHIAAITNSTSLTATDRLGNTKKTLAGLSAEFPNASANANTATTQAVIATTKADIATTQANLAAASKVAAESARDSALIQAGVYTTEALGRADVADGQSFKVQGSGNTAAFEYRRVNAGTASTLIATYPSAAYVTSNVNRLSAIEFKALFTRAGYVNASGVFTVDASVWGTTELLPIADVTVYSLSLFGHTAVSAIAFYNSSKVFISGVSGSTNAPVTNYPAPPNGAAFVSFTYNITEGASQVFSGTVKSAVIPKLDLRIGTLEFAPLFTRSGYTNTSGVLTAGSSWGTTQLLPVSSVSVSTLALFGHPGAASIAFYDSARTYISGVSAATEGAMVNTYPSVPANAAYVAFTYNKIYPSGQVFSGSVTPPVVNASMSSVDYAKYATTLGYITTTGADSSTDANWLRTNFIGMNPGETVDCNMVGFNAICSVAFYNASKVFISGVSATGTSVPAAMLVRVVTAPANTAYFRLSMANPSTNSLAPGVLSTAFVSRDIFSKVLTLESKATYEAVLPSRVYSAPRKLKLSPTDKILLYGDSISSTDYPWYKAAMESLTGAVVYNGGFSGNTSAQLAANAKMQRVYDYGARLVIALTGGNDSGAAGTVGTFNGSVAGEPMVSESSIAGDYVGTYFIQSISHIIRKFNAAYSNVRARANLTGSETDAEKMAKIDAVLKPVLVFCTTLPRNITNSSDVSSQPASWARKRDAIAECCAKYKVHCVDLTNKIPVDMTLEPYYTGPTNMTRNDGIYYMDGVHPNKYLSQVMAELICSDVGL